MRTVCLALFLTLLAGAAMAQDAQQGSYTDGYVQGGQTPYVPATPPNGGNADYYNGYNQGAAQANAAAQAQQQLDAQQAQAQQQEQGREAQRQVEEQGRAAQRQQEEWARQEAERQRQAEEQARQSSYNNSNGYSQ